MLKSNSLFIATKLLSGFSLPPSLCASGASTVKEKYSYLCASREVIPTHLSAKHCLDHPATGKKIHEIIKNLKFKI